MNIRKAALKNEMWSGDEDDMLIHIIKYLTSLFSGQAMKNRWNEVAKLLFYDSNKKFFRTAKQCRERWNNYLDPSKTRY